MVLAFSRFKVANGLEEAVRTAFFNRPKLVDNSPGFLGLEVFTDVEDGSIFYLLTRWTDVSAFRSWHGSHTHKEAHRGIPKGLKLDPAYTLIRAAERLPLAGEASVEAWEVMDAAPAISSFVSRSGSVCWLRVSVDGTIVATNGAIAAALGREASALKGTSLWTILTDPDAAVLKTLVGEPGTSRTAEPQLVNFLDAHGHPQTFSMCIDVQPDGVLIIGEPVSGQEVTLRQALLGLNNELAVLLREHERKNRLLREANEKLEATTKELQSSYWHIRKLQEVLPICMQCGKVKTGAADWQDVVDFLREHTLFLSHGYCPACAEDTIRAYRMRVEEQRK